MHLYSVVNFSLFGSRGLLSTGFSNNRINISPGEGSLLHTNSEHKGKSMLFNTLITDIIISTSSIEDKL
jgi:hypothetical protein